MKLYFDKRPFSWEADYTIYEETGHPAYQVVAAPEEKEYTVDEIIAEVKSWNQEHSDGSPEDKEPGDDA